MEITSRSNPRVVAAASLNEKKYRDESGLFLIEGRKLFREAADSGVDIKEIFCLPEYEDAVRAARPQTEPYVVRKDIIEKISYEKSPEGIICVASRIDKIHFFNKIYINEDFASEKRFFILSGVRDPGNIGTIVRTAAAMGVDEIVMSQDCADIYSPRAVRGAMGSLFRQRISYVTSLAGTVRAMTDAGRKVFAAMPDENAAALGETDLPENAVFVVGNEGSGVALDVCGVCSGKIFIPMKNGVESLNVAAASAILMWYSAFGRK